MINLWEGFEILPSHVNDDGLVDYEGLSKNLEFKIFVGELNGFDISKLKTDSERKAFFINLYNTYTHSLGVIDGNYKRVSEIKKIPGIGKKILKHKFFNFRKNPISLNYIEKILRTIKDPRIHSAIVSASLSAPPLRQEAYLPDKLEMQLNGQMMRFCIQPYVVHVGKKRKSVFGKKIDTLRVSPIFKWVEDDFKVKPFNGVERTIKKYTDFSIRKCMEGPVKLEYQGYDWTWNSQSQGKVREIF